MNMNKIGSFLRELRKEKGLTQEQLAEVFGVAGRTVSRWETASNMPDLSILIHLAEFYGVDVKEILDGERKSDNTDKEFKETLVKVADYSKVEKEKIAKIGLFAFWIIFLVGIVAFLFQFLIFDDIRFFVGEAVTLVVGGFAFVFMAAHNGLWKVLSEIKGKTVSDWVVSIIIPALFTAVFALSRYRLKYNIREVLVPSAVLFFASFFVGFILLRILSAWSRKTKK